MNKLLLYSLTFVSLQRAGILINASKRRQQRDCASLLDCGEDEQMENRILTNLIIPEYPNCPPCSRISCPIKRPRKLKCKGGLTVGVCNCCPTCARIEGEECGGKHWYLGRCDVGLHCALQADPYDLTSLPSIVVAGDNKRGRCVRDAARESECKRECTPEFCLANRKAICSARNTAIERQDCQGDCQHTSCSACLFQEEPVCLKCRANDFSCMKRFARCIKKKLTCSRKKFPCNRKIKKPHTGKFVCWVPGCL